MKGHTTTIVGVAGSWRGKCSCREAGPIQDEQWKCDEWCRDHIKRIERTRLHLDSPPTLARAAKQYREAAERDDVTPENAALFIQLADEIDRRIEGSSAGTEQLALFDE